MTVDTPTDLSKSVHNRCVIAVCRGVFVLLLFFLKFSIGFTAFVIGHRREHVHVTLTHVMPHCMN